MASALEAKDREDKEGPEASLGGNLSPTATAATPLSGVSFDSTPNGLLMAAIKMARYVRGLCVWVAMRKEGFDADE